MNFSFHEIISISAFILATVAIIKVSRRDMDKTEKLLSVFIVGLFFGLGWEPEGTGIIWRYKGFSIYTFMDIPLSLFLGWAWGMLLCYLIAGKIMRGFTGLGMRNYWITSTIAFFISGILIALIIEPLFVALGWWEYLEVGEKAALFFPYIGAQFHLTVIVGWGMLTVINLNFSTKAVKPLANKITGKLRLGYIRALTLSCGLLGLFSGWFSWQLVVLFATLVESETPRLYFTGNCIVKLEWITGTQLLLIILLLTASFFAAYLWKNKKNKKMG